MRGGIARAALALCAALGASARAQVPPNSAARYLPITDVTDARALWVNPAGFGLVDAASLNGDVSVANPGAGGRLEQFTLGLASRGLAFGYERDVFQAGGRGHTMRLGYAVGRGGLAAGVAAALYREAGSGTGWDAGILYDSGRWLAVGGVIANLGEPVIGGVTLPVTYRPGATLRLGAGRAALSADGRFSSTGALGYSFTARASVRAGRAGTGAGTLGVLARLDTDRSLNRTAFAFGLALGGADVVGLVGTTPGTLSRLDAVSLYGVSTRPLRAGTGTVRD